VGVKVRIGIDIDDTITYTYEMLLPMVAVRYGVSLSKLYDEVPTYKKLDKMFPDYAHFVSESLPVCAKLTPVREGALEVIRKLKEEGLWVIGTDGDAETMYYNQDLKGPLAIIIGSEGFGMSKLVKENADILIKIPMKGKITSLNASVSAGIVIYEALRQRM
jgi:hypothetical protein